MICSKSWVSDMKIYSLGSLNIDYVYSVEHFVRGGETLASTKMEVFPGGKGLNQSVALAKAGAQVIHGAVVGQDGQFLIDTLRAAGVETERIQVTDSPSGHAIIQVDRSGQNCILLFAGTNHSITPQYVEHFLRDASAGDLLVLQNEVNGLDFIFASARARGMDIVFNPSPFNADLTKLPLDKVSLWFCNEIEGEALFGCTEPEGIAAAFLRRYPHSRLVLTLGEAGSLYADSAGILRQPAHPAAAVDTTAAGDTFTGYFLAAIATGLTPALALRRASRAAAVTVSRPGASVSIPWAWELDENL